MNQIRVSVNILTKNRRELLKKCLHSLSKQSYENFEIIVLDEYSVDGTEAMVSQIAKYQTNINFMQRDVKGLGYGRNMGVKVSRGEIIAFIDDDEEAHPDWLKNGVEAMEKFQVDIVRGAIYFPNGKLFRELRTDKMQFPTANIFYRKKVIEDIGMFDERFVYGAEDIDLGVRAIKQGYKLVLCKEAITIHCFLSNGKLHHVKSLLKIGRHRAMNTVLLFKKHKECRQDLFYCIFFNKNHFALTVFLAIILSFLILNMFALKSLYFIYTLMLIFVLIYLKFYILVDYEISKYPQRLFLFPLYLLIDFIEYISVIKGSIKYRFLVL